MNALLSLDPTKKKLDIAHLFGDHLQAGMPTSSLVRPINVLPQVYVCSPVAYAYVRRGDSW